MHRVEWNTGYALSPQRKIAFAKLELAAHSSVERSYTGEENTSNCVYLYVLKMITSPFGQHGLWAPYYIVRVNEY